MPNNTQKNNSRSIRCQARTKTGKQCKKMSLPGFDFCRVHGFGKIKGAPWYENAIFLAVIGLVFSSAIGLVIARFYFLEGPSVENQQAILAKQDQSLNSENETLRIIRRMETFQKENDPALKAKFNLGYILFTATERKEVIPLNSPMDEILKIDWKSGYDVSFSENQVLLRLPDMVIQPPESARFESHGVTVVLMRRIEPWARPGIYNNGKIRVAFKVVQTNETDIMVAMGIESPPEPRPPLQELMK